MLTITTLRLALHAAGYIPLPVNGKIPIETEWQLTNPDEATIRSWQRSYPQAPGTGIQTKHTPALDLDIMDAAIIEHIVGLVLEYFTGRGKIPVRTGRAPKCALLFRTSTPFKKMARKFIAPDGTKHKIEFLGDGQQVVVDGIHPDTRQPYYYRNGKLPDITREELIEIDANEARALFESCCRELVEQFGYRIDAKEPKDEFDDGHRGGADWSKIDNPIDHDDLRRMPRRRGASTTGSANCAASLGRHEPGPKRHARRRPLQPAPPQGHEHRAVDSAIAKAGTDGETEEARQQAEEEAQRQADEEARKAAGQPAPVDGTAHGYSWHFFAHGDADPAASQKCLVEGLLPETGAALISGQWGTYKTFVTFNLAAALMRGTAFAGLTVARRGGVLWIAAEGQGSGRGHRGAVRSAVGRCRHRHHRQGGQSAQDRRPQRRRRGQGGHGCARRGVGCQRGAVLRHRPFWQADRDRNQRVVIV
jgi:hypothetical protein